MEVKPRAVEAGTRYSLERCMRMELRRLPIIMGQQASYLGLLLTSEVKVCLYKSLGKMERRVLGGK